MYIFLICKLTFYNTHKGEVEKEDLGGGGRVGGWIEMLFGFKQMQITNNTKFVIMGLPKKYTGGIMVGG